MLVANVIPSRSLICLNVFDKDNGNPIEEFHIDYAQKRTRLISFGAERGSMLTECNCETVIPCIIAAINIESKGRLGRIISGFEGDIVTISLDLLQAFELVLGRDGLIEVAQDIDSLCGEIDGKRWNRLFTGELSDSVLLGNNQHWIVDANPVSLGSLLN